MAEEVIESKNIVVRKIASSVKLDRAEVEKVLDAFILEAATPRIFKAGGTVGFFDNHCNNNCKEELAKAALKGTIERM
jgi:hypothetical protein